MKLYSKSFKQIYMDWIYIKSLRNIKLQRISRYYEKSCVIRLPPPYPIRPIVKHQFAVIGGFHQHPNSSSSM
jgi:hypothetical protein